MRQKTRFEGLLSNRQWLYRYHRWLRSQDSLSKIGTSLIVSQLTPKSAARDRMLLVLAGARIADSCSGVSLRARGRYLGRELASCRDGHRRVGASSVRRSGKRMRQRTSGPRDGEEPTPGRFRPFIPPLD